jgi:hypothetical protein
VVANPADLGLAVLGGPEVESYLADGLGPGYVNPATYTSAASIPSESTTAAVSAPSLAAALSSAPVMAEPAQATAISQIISAMNGSKPASTAVSTLLLSPLLEGLVNRG